MKRVVIACGSGIATSTIMDDGVRTFLDTTGIKYTTIQCNILELGNYVEGADVIISSTKLSTDYGVPTIIGTAYITGIGEEELNEKLLEVLSK
ncbi:MAG: PTS sugar transporter subunit IIB [Erysipelotrichaceae bacterium]|jgi:PTS system galactitol-specific IIB component|nr:PTS sugar transporter subunit IIB [Erysipelotrichaceae bacterium]MBQ1307974.1 PTS sugar transporter subunit IIB [Erysipelotrichaceae bacterium]MBQ1534110.1 PTS sugar transporter subunit IIB [Erysipelotrichaceae bacterium]MBQ1787713.1 PTS sugar transporter subunit IIB [Erysipelotrichaceae bacterium]MBQ2659089.1 PTS sugar transporter subunit IIB [Erysipelotrichaceae bacterium]